MEDMTVIGDVQLADQREKAWAVRAEILVLVTRYAQLTAAPPTFVPGRSTVNYAGRVYNEAELTNLVEASLEFWLTAGRYATRLERRLADYVGAGKCLLTNSGSSANLVAFSTLTSSRLGERRISRGDEVITVAAGFPTTVAPILQYGAVPVFIDVDPDTVNLDPDQLAAALSPRTKAVMAAHTLGNPFDIQRVRDFCHRHDLWLVEDNCDGLGSWYGSPEEDTKPSGRTGSFGHLSTSSFYPAHHMTTGEGGAVYTSDPILAQIAESMRDWGRDCYCGSGKSNTCGKRFCQQFGELPAGYDHKYVYSELGYNLKMTDLQAAVGLAQLEKLDGFGTARRRNHNYLRTRLEPYADRLAVQMPTPDADPSWFGFLVTVQPDAGITRDELVAILEQAKIQTRMLFAGNMVRQPCISEVKERDRDYRLIGDLANTDRVMRDSFWIGVYPGMEPVQLDYVGDVFDCAMKKRHG